MINLSDIIQSAHGGQAIDTLSARFGLTPEQTQSALNALVPALQMGLQNKLEGGGGIGSILAHLGSGANQSAYQDPGAAQSPTTTAQGGSILGDLFGQGSTTSRVAQQVATETGIPVAIIEAMLPVVASILMGGLSHGAQNGSFGGILSSILGSVMGGGQTAPAPSTVPDPSTAPEPEGGLGGVVGSILGEVFGGRQSAPASQALDPAPDSYPELQPRTGAPSSAQAILSEISNMIESGASASPTHEAALANILGR